MVPSPGRERRTSVLPLKPTPTLVTWSVRDASNNLGTATQNVTIVDTKPPTISVKLSPAVLWPPDHKLVPITATHHGRGQV